MDHEQHISDSFSLGAGADHCHDRLVLHEIQEINRKIRGITLNYEGGAVIKICGDDKMGGGVIR